MPFFKRFQPDNPGQIYTGYVFKTGFGPNGDFDTRPLRKDINKLLDFSYHYGVNTGNSATQAFYNYTNSMTTTPVLFFVTTASDFSLSITNEDILTRMTPCGRSTIDSTSSTGSYRVERKSDNSGCIFINNGYSNPYRRWRTGYLWSISEYSPRLYIQSVNSGSSITFTVRGTGSYGYQYIYLNRETNGSGGVDVKYSFAYGPTYSTRLDDTDYATNGYAYSTIGQCGSFESNKTFTIYERYYLSLDTDRYNSDYPIGLIVFSKTTGQAIVIMGDN